MHTSTIVILQSSNNDSIEHDESARRAGVGRSVRRSVGRSILVVSVNVLHCMN